MRKRGLPSTALSCPADEVVIEEFARAAALKRLISVNVQLRTGPVPSIARSNVRSAPYRGTG